MGGNNDLSWRAKLAKANINIKNMHGGIVYFDFAYRPYAGANQKWASTIYWPGPDDTIEVVAHEIRELVLDLRKELER